MPNLTIETSQSRRTPMIIMRALFERQHYYAICQTFMLCNRPFDFIGRYVFGILSQYPVEYNINTPTGIINVKAYSREDILTINEIFFREDYPAESCCKTIVDFGSNIGISALYFLSRNNDSYIYCYEPLPQNIDRLIANLRPFEGRYELRPVAVGIDACMVEFGWESSGRYGGIERKLTNQMNVECIDANHEISRIIAIRESISILKIDIEYLEIEITKRLTKDIVVCIDKVYVESFFSGNPFPDTHRLEWRKPITKLIKLDS